MDFNDFKHDKLKAGILIGFAIVIVFLFFLAGLFVGGEKAKFSNRLGERYYRDFIRPGGPPPGLFDPGYLNSHGVTGKIVSIAGPELTVAENNVNKTVDVEDNTIIHKGALDAKLADLKVGDELTVIGSPDSQGVIEAKLINVK